MSAIDQVECVPYRCSLSAASCAARYAFASMPPRRMVNRSHVALCGGCADGHARWVRLGSVKRESPVYAPRVALGSAW